MVRRDRSRTVAPGEAIARWRRTLATLADNDNVPARPRAITYALIALVAVPATVAVVAAGIRFLLR